MKKPENLFQNWWWIALCAIIFASVGNFIVAVLPSRYEQSADIQILFEPSQTINWTDKEMLSFTETVGGLIEDPTIQSTVLNALHSEGFEIDERQFYALTSMEQRYYGWKIKVNTSDPTLTKAFLAIWKTTIEEAIENDRNNSNLAQIHRAIAASWIPCLQQLPSEPMHPYCNPQNAAGISSSYNKVIQQFQESQEKVLFLSNYPPAYTIEFLGTSDIIQTTLFKPSAVIFIGLLTGLLVGALTIQTPWTLHLRIQRGNS